MTFLACALHQLFVRSCDLAHHGLHCSHVCVCTHHSSLQHLLFCVRFRCSSVSIWMNFSACGCLLAPQGGITLTTRAVRSQHYILSNSCKLVRALPVQMSASTRESHGAATSSSVFCPQVTHSVNGSQVQTGPTRTVTSDLLSATLADAATQLSFAAFLERCIFVHASPPLQLPASTPSLDVASLTFHTPLPLGTFLRNSRSWSPWLHLLRLTLSALRVLDQSPLVTS